MRRAKKIVLLILLFLVVCARTSIAQDNLIVFPKRVGRITASSTEEELAKIYGKENLSRKIRPWGDGGYGCATVMFIDSDKELNIFWRNESYDYDASESLEQQKNCEGLPSRMAPAGVVIATNVEKRPVQKPTYWRTPEGVYVGITLLELEAKNQAPIDFDSSSSCFDGGITNWSGGKLKNLEELLSYSKLSYPKGELERIKKSDGITSRALPRSLKSKIFLSNIDFSFPNPR